MDQNLSEVTVNCFTNINAIRRSEHSITCMKIRRSGRSTISELVRQQLTFPNIEKLSFDEGYFNDSVTQFIARLPKLKYLEFEFTTVQNPKCIEQFIPTLERLTVLNNLLLENGGLFTVENVKRAIQLNPQLKGIRFRCDAFHPIPDRRNAKQAIQLIRFINDKLQQLQYLGIYFSVDYYNDLKEPILFKCVTEAVLNVQVYSFQWAPTSINMPVSFVQLRDLQIFSLDMYADDCVDFAISNKSLEKLKLHFHWTNESDDQDCCLVYDISYEEDDQEDSKIGDELGEQGYNSGDSRVNDDSEDVEMNIGNSEYNDDDEDDDNVSDEYDEDDDENLQYDCYLKPFFKLTKSLPNLKELSIGPITKFTGEDIVEILSPSKTLQKLHVKLRYPLYHRRDARYAGVSKIEQYLRFVKENDALEGKWSYQVEFKFKPGSLTEFRIADLIFQRNSQ